MEGMVSMGRLLLIFLAMIALTGCETEFERNQKAELKRISDRASQTDAKRQNDIEKGILWFRYRIVQVIDKENMLGDANAGGRISWLSGWNTTSSVDGDETPLMRVKLIGTRRYDSASGSRTVNVYQYVSTIEP
jgi:hypothetical protein